jgi:hypothetical protein
MSEEGESSPQMADEAPPVPSPQQQQQSQQQQTQTPPSNIVSVTSVIPSSGTFGSSYLQQVQQTEDWTGPTRYQNRALPVTTAVDPRSIVTITQPT